MNTMSLKISTTLHESLERAAKSRKVSKSEVVRTALEENFANDLSNGEHTLTVASVWAQRWTGKFKEARLQSRAQEQMPLLGSTQVDERLEHIIAKHLH